MEFAKIESKVVEVLHPLPGELPEAVMPVVLRIVGPLRDRVDDGVLSEERDHAFDSVLGETGISLAHGLDVLLRHHPLRQPGGFNRYVAGSPLSRHLTADDDVGAARPSADT